MLRCKCCPCSLNSKTFLMNRRTISQLNAPIEILISSHRVAVLIRKKICISCKVVNFLTFSVLIMRLPVVDGTEGLITWWWFQHYGCINHNTLITPWKQKWHTKEMWKTRHFKVCTCPSNIELILLTLRLDLAQKKRRQQEPERSYKMQKGKKRSGKRWKQKSA